MQAPLLYPLKFQSIIKEKIWGGERLNHLLSKSIDNKKCGELWEIADVGDDVSVVENGSFKGKTLTQLIEQFKSDLLGHKVFKEFGSKFPLLVKFIDANRDLSIQVHPNDLQAKKKKALGKTEFWYVLEANEGATLYSGFSKCISPQQFELALNDQTFTDQRFFRLSPAIRDDYDKK